MSLLTLLFTFAVGLAVGWMLFRGPGATAATPPPAQPTLPTDDEDALPRDLELEGKIFAYVSEHEVYHINDACQALEHPRGARYVRAHFHRLMERGEIVYRDMRYRV
jgi:hypothetical protein